MEEILETFNVVSDSGETFQITSIKRTGVKTVIATSQPTSEINFIESSGAIVRKLKDGSFKILFDKPVIVRRA